MLKKLSTISLMIILCASLLAGCKKRGGEEDEIEEDVPAKQKYNSKGDEATVTGVVSFVGEPPAAKKIDMNADQNCAAAEGDKMTDDVVVTDGKLANVFVFVRDKKLDGYAWPVPSDPVLLDQLGCRYHPRVLGIQTNQLFRVTNSDRTTHNVHPTPSKNPEWNNSQNANGPPIEKKFARPETLIPVKCNVHPWMKAHVGVLEHPFYAVTAKDGSYTIKGLPPGKYTLVAWHEMGGSKGSEQTMDITVGANENKKQDFSFSPKVAYAPTSLSVEPALVLP